MWLCQFQHCPANDRNTLFSPNTYFTEREENFLKHKWIRENSQVSFLEWSEGRKVPGAAIPFHIYHLRNIFVYFFLLSKLQAQILDEVTRKESNESTHLAQSCLTNSMAVIGIYQKHHYQNTYDLLRSFIH